MVSLQKTDKQESSQSTEDEEIVKTNVLRKAYGDACLKVVVKKCYKVKIDLLRFTQFTVWDLANY